MFCWVCEPFWQIIESKKGVKYNPLIYIWSIRGQENNVDLELLSEAGTVLQDLTCGIWYYFQVNSIRIGASFLGHPVDIHKEDWEKLLGAVENVQNIQLPIGRL